MKKMHVILLFAALAILTSCGEAILDPEPLAEDAAPIVFNLTASHPDATKAVKTGWENGDAIFVFFDKVAAPKFLKMSYNGSVWSSAEYEGAMATPGALGLKNGDTGNMRAVFLPFGSDATVSASGTSFTFSKTYYTYYLTATLDYTVSNGKVNGAFQMEIPDDYVQFFVEDAAATDEEAYLLETDAVIPVGVASIAADGTITETNDKTYVDDMPGYVYDNGTDPKGYVFTGKLNRSYAYSGSYYFAKTRTADNSRADYFVTGNTLTSHSAVKLPANNNVYESEDFGANGKWIPVGPDLFVNFYSGSAQSQPNLAWATCNYGASKPEEIGTRLSFIDATAYDNSNKTISLPSPDIFNPIGNKSFKQTALTIHGQAGFVFSASRGFIYLPVTTGTSTCDYWSNGANNDDTAWYFSFSGPGTDDENKYMFYQSKTQELAVRMIR